MTKTDTIEHVVTLNTSIHRACDECDRFNKSAPDDANHYIKDHGYQLLHVGQETDHGDEGLWHSTVFVLGTTDGSNAKRVEEQRAERFKALRPVQISIPKSDKAT